MCKDCARSTDHMSTGRPYPSFSLIISGATYPGEPHRPLQPGKTASVGRSTQKRWRFQERWHFEGRVLRMGPVNKVHQKTQTREKVLVHETLGASSPESVGPIDVACETKVGNLDRSIRRLIREKKVLGLEISMDNALAVQVGQGTHNLPHDPSRILLREVAVFSIDDSAMAIGL